jgi:transcription antitermination factor NusG
MEDNVNSHASDSRWFAVWTRSRQEKVAATMLNTLGVHHFLPLRSELRQWSDRKQMVNVPLFAGYLFVRMNPTKGSRLEVLKARGVAGFVGNQTGPLPIPDGEIETIRTMFQRGAPCSPHVYLKEGDRVRMVRGPLTGIEGTLLRSGAKTQLVISIHIIQRSVAVVVSEQDVESILTYSTLKDVPAMAAA